MTMQPTPTDGPGRRDAEARERLLRGALWALFALLVLLGGWAFLRACALQPLLGLGHNYCPAPVDHSALQRAVDEGDDLRRQVHLAEMQVAETPPCAPPPIPPHPHPRPTPPPPQPTPDERKRAEEIEKKRERKGGKQGKLQITLKWQTRDDLDLELECPGGTISSYPNHKGPGICGDGVKDLDANRNAVPPLTTDPIENIAFGDDIPAGTYSITVIETQSFRGVKSKVPFTLLIKWNGQERVCNGVVSFIPEDQATRDADGKIGGDVLSLTWTMGDDLPSCNFTTSIGRFLGFTK